MYTNKTHFNAMTRHRDIILCRQAHFLWAVSDFTVSDIFKRLKLKSFTIHCLAILKRVSKIHFNVYKHIFRMSLVVQQHFLQIGIFGYAVKDVDGTASCKLRSFCRNWNAALAGNQIRLLR